MITEYQKQSIDFNPFNNPNKDLCGTIAQTMNVTLNYDNVWIGKGHGGVDLDERVIYLHCTNKFETDHDIFVFLHEVGHLFNGRQTKQKYARDNSNKGFCGVLKWEIMAWKHAIMLYNLFFNKEVDNELIQFICECLLTYSEPIGHKTTELRYRRMVLKWLGRDKEQN